MRVEVGLGRDAGPRRALSAEVGPRDRRRGDGLGRNIVPAHHGPETVEFGRQGVASLAMVAQVLTQLGNLGRQCDVVKVWEPRGQMVRYGRSLVCSKGVVVSGVSCSPSHRTAWGLIEERTR